MVHITDVRNDQSSSGRSFQTKLSIEIGTGTVRSAFHKHVRADYRLTRHRVNNGT